jgi:hypothetical protein
MNDARTWQAHGRRHADADEIAATHALAPALDSPPDPSDGLRPVIKVSATTAWDMMEVWLARPRG